METHSHKDMTGEVALHDYAPLNKPWGIHTWLTSGSGRHLPDNTVVLIVDPDMVFRRSDASEVLRILKSRVLSKNLPLGQDYRYTVLGMKARNWMVPRHFIPESDFSEEHLQSIGPPMMMQKAQLRRLAPLWHDVTRRIVSDRRLHGLVHDGRDPAPWIAEMYGYTIAAAMTLPQHETDALWRELSTPQPPYLSDWMDPLLLHYSFTFRLCGKEWGKSRISHLTGGYSDLLDCSLNPDSLEHLRPPLKSEVSEASCGICVGAAHARPGVDVNVNTGVTGDDRRDCTRPEDPTLNRKKQFSFEAWSLIYKGLTAWRAAHC